MKPRDRRQGLRRATLEAHAQGARTRAEIERREDPSPRPGDVYALAETAEQSVLWVVLAEVPGHGPEGEPRYLLVAADLHPLVGSCDVAAPAGAAAGALCLRCGFDIELGAAALGAARRSGRLEGEALERARRKRAQIEAGAVSGSVLERDTDDEPEYQDWLEEGPAAAQAALAGHQEESLHAGGIDGVTGGYLMPVLPSSRAAAWARSEAVDPGVLHLLQHVHRLASRPHLGLPVGVDPTDPAAAGWGIVFHAAESPAVRDALRPLLEHRRERAGAERTRILEYRPGDAWRQWLSRHGVAAGRVQPARVPYYLLLVGPPTAIPYDFQLLLGVEYAVGRLSFETPEEYRRYAEGVVERESRDAPAGDRSVVFFAPRHPFDPATRASADALVKPLIDGLPGSGRPGSGRPATATEPARPGVAAGRSLLIRRLWGEAATKANLAAVFHPPEGKPPAALLFAAGHGLGWPADHPRQRLSQGALLCQDWPARGRIDVERHGFGAADLGDDARVAGTVAFLHASYSAGTPEHEGFSPAPGEPPSRLAAEPFVAGLPRRLLAHPGGGAAAVIGLVDRVWGAAGAALQPLQHTLEGLLDGWPVGHAVRELKKRYAALATELHELRRKMAMGARPAEAAVAALWSRRNDARSTVVLGDPAVRAETKGADRART